MPTVVPRYYVISITKVSVVQEFFSNTWCNNSGRRKEKHKLKSGRHTDLYIRTDIVSQIISVCIPVNP